MARNRLQQNDNSYADQSVPSGNPYAQGGGGGYGQYPPSGGGGGGYNDTAYGQQQHYAAGGPPANANGAGDFWSELSATNALLDDMERKIQEIQQAHQQILNSTDANSIAFADKTAAEAKEMRADCKAAIQRLYNAAKGNPKQKTQANTAKQRFTRLLEEHQNIEKTYRQKTKERAERQYRIVKPDATDEEVREVIESDNPQVFAQALLNSNRYGAARGAYREVQERHAEIQKIEKTMTELGQMFQELSMLVEQQDEAIREVETTTYGVHQDVERGNLELDGAIGKARAARKKKIICLIITIVIVIIVAAVLAGVLATQLNKGDDNK